jgi:hypothetical protein
MGEAHLARDNISAWRQYNKTPLNHMLTLSSPNGTLCMRVDTRNTKGAVVLTTLMVLLGLVMEYEPPLLCGTPTGITPLRGILVIGLIKHSGRWRELDDSIARWGNFVPPLTR